MNSWRQRTKADSVWSLFNTKTSPDSGLKEGLVGGGLTSNHYNQPPLELGPEEGYLLHVGDIFLTFLLQCNLAELFQSGVAIWENDCNLIQDQVCVCESGDTHVCILAKNRGGPQLRTCMNQSWSWWLWSLWRWP